jgi:peptidyl-dipeptidase Dcp
MAIVSAGPPAYAAETDFGPSNPFYAESTLPFHAPPFDKIKDTDYQPAIEAGMAQQREEINAIANNAAAPTFENTIVAMEKSGRLFDRALSAFGCVTGANLNPVLQQVQKIEAPKLAAHSDAIFLDAKLFQRVKAIYDTRNSLKLDAESLRLVEYYYKKFVHSGANLSEADKTELKKLNEEESTLSQAFTQKLLAATKEAAFVTTDKAALAAAHAFLKYQIKEHETGDKTDVTKRK